MNYLKRLRAALLAASDNDDIETLEISVEAAGSDAGDAPGDREYTCAMCKGVFESDRSDDEAREEGERIWGRGHSFAVVCDDCYRLMMPDAPS